VLTNKDKLSQEEVLESHRCNRARMNLASTGRSDARKWVGEDLGVGAMKSDLGSDCPHDVFRETLTVLS
jgi:hypothetical protein